MKERDYSEYFDKVYNRLTIKRVSLEQVNPHCRMAVAECICVCGNKAKILLCNIKNNHTTSCGCYRKEREFQPGRNARTVINNFDTLTDASSYWAGFIYGDGSIDIKNKLQVALSKHTSHTIDHLTKLSKYLFDIDYVNIYKDICHIQVTNKTLANNLQKFGIIPNKTYDVDLILPNEYRSDFIRGYWDADGWFLHKKYIYNNKRLYYKTIWGLCSYRCGNLEKINEELPVQSKPFKRKRQNIYWLRFQCREEIAAIFKYLYPNNLELAYKRKWNKICKFLKQYNYL